MTGLNTFKDEIIEIATVADKNLNVIEEGPVIAIKTKKNFWMRWMIGILNNIINLVWLIEFSVRIHVESRK